MTNFLPFPEFQNDDRSNDRAMKNRSFTFLLLGLCCAMSLLAGTLVHANNLPPVAVIDLTPDKAVYYHGEIIALYGGNSYVQSSGNINYYQWYINGELKLAGPGATSYDHTVVMEPGLAEQTLTIRLRVQHSNGLWGEQTVTRTEKQKPGQHYYLTDHLGSVRATVNAAGTMVGWDDYYPFGMVMPGRSSNSANPNDLYKFTGHERDREAGLEIDFMNARTYDSEIGRFLQRDPHAANYPGISPYVYVANNPLIFIDPDGKDIYIVQNEDGTFRIIGGIQNGGTAIYLFPNGEGPPEHIRDTITEYSFFNDNGNPVEGAIIDLNSTEGQNFLDAVIEANPLLAYIFDGQPGGDLDFKNIGLKEAESLGLTRDQHHNRGSVAADGRVGSARDFGNMAPGFQAGRVLMPWLGAALAFGMQEIYQRGQFVNESSVSRAAQREGHLMGVKHTTRTLQPKTIVPRHP